jgi:hypothetical protein
MPASQARGKPARGPAIFIVMPRFMRGIHASSGGMDAPDEPGHDEKKASRVH